MRRAGLIGLAILVLVPLLLIVAARIWFDPAMIRAQLQDATTRATGKQLVIDGPVTLGWGPRLRVQGLRLLNPPGASRPDLARAASAEIGVAVLPLLSGRVVLRGVQLDGVDVLLERDGDGRGNWERPPAPASAGLNKPASEPASAAPGRRPEVSVESAALTNTTITYRDAGRTLVAEVPRLMIADGHSLAGQLVLAGVPMAIAGTGPFPLAVTLTADHVPFGTLALDAARLTLTAAGPDAPVSLDGAATVGSAPLTMSVRAANLQSVLLDGVLDRASVTLAGATAMAEGRIETRVPGGDVALRVLVPAVAPLGTALGQSWPDWHGGDLTMRVARTAAGATLAGNATLAGSDAAFQLALEWPAWRVDGTVSSNRIDLDALLPLRALAVAGPATEPPAAAPSPTAPPPTAPAPPPRTLPFDMLTRGAGDVRLTVATLHWHGTDMTGLGAHAVLDGGTLTIDPAQAILGSGPLTAQLVATAATRRLSVSLLAPGSDAAAVAAWAGLPPAIAGRAELDVALDGTGADGPAMLASLTGPAGLALVGGTADLAAIPGLGAAIAQVTRGLPIPGAGGLDIQTRIRCLAVRTDLAAGQANVATFVLDTPRLTAVGEGAAGIVDRTLALRLRLAIPVGGGSVLVPLRIGGVWAVPTVKVENDSGRAAVSIAQGEARGADGDLCGPALALARNGRPGPAAPAADAPKAAKPADLLRSFLR